MRSCLSCAAALGLLLSACAAPQRTIARAGEKPVASAQRCVRICEVDSNMVELQIAVRKFVPARRKGPTVWLTGVSHIGDTNYYSALQSHLAAQTLVLYEGVGEHNPVLPDYRTAGPRDTARQSRKSEIRMPKSETNSIRREMQMPKEREQAAPNISSRLARISEDWDTQTNEHMLPARPAARTEQRPSLQSSMAASLGLVFQLEAIDYARSNFRNSDLSVSQLRELLEEQRPVAGGASAAQSFEGLLQVMEGGSLLDVVLQVAARFLGASPQLQGMGRLALIDALGEINGDPARLRGLGPGLQQLLNVLLARRNEKVISDLQIAIKKLGRSDSVAIFYGTGHMPDLARRLRQDLNYRPADEIWLTAFSVNLAQAGISQGEAQLIRGLVRRELEQMTVERP